MDKIFEKSGDRLGQPEVFPQGMPTPEKPSNPENRLEQKIDQIPQEENKNLHTEQNSEAGAKQAVVSKTPSQLREEAIDRILSDGLGDIFVKLPPKKQQEFKVEGEKTVKKINQLIERGKLNLNILAKMIRHWLSIIPGVNRFFLEQDAKIKADKIMKINGER